MSIGWLTPVLVRAEPYWPTCDVDDDDALDTLLTAARIQCEAFAPSLADDVAAPGNYLLAQSMQARALYRSTTVGSGDQMGVDGLTVTIFPLDWTVKALLRPRRGMPVLR